MMVGVAVAVGVAVGAAVDTLSDVAVIGVEDNEGVAVVAGEVVVVMAVL